MLIRFLHFDRSQKFNYLTAFRIDHNRITQYEWLSPPGKKPYTNLQLMELSALGKKNSPVNLQKLPR
ncbi:unnamed protein product, partial [Nesidiocoris tenuis]